MKTLIFVCLLLLLPILDINGQTKPSDILGFGKLNKVVYSPDGTKVASCGSKGIYIFDVSSGDTIYSIRDNIESVNTIEFSSDGNKLASAGGNKDSTVIIWDLKTRSEICRLIGHSRSIVTLCFSQDGSKIATGSLDKSIKIWDANTGKIIKTLINNMSVLDIKFNSDAKKLISCGGGTGIILWDLENFKSIHSFNHYTYKGFLSLSFSIDDSKIIAGSVDNKIYVWDAKTFEELYYISGHRNSVSNVSFSKDGKKIISSSYDSTIKIWDVSTGDEIRTLKGHRTGVRNFSINYDESSIASAGNDNKIKLWNFNNGLESKTINSHTSGINSITISPDGKQIASVSNDSTILIWDLKTKTIINRLFGHSNSITKVLYSPDGKFIASGGKDSSIKIWDANSGLLLQNLIGHNIDILDLSFSPDSKELVSISNDKTIKYWDVNTGKQKLFKHPSIYLPSSICFSPDGKMIAFTDFHSSVIDTSGKLLRESTWSNYNFGVCFLNNGNYVASQSGGSIYIWVTFTGKSIKILYSGNVENGFSHSSNICSYDSKIAGGCEDYSVKVWDIDTDEVTDLIGHSQDITSVCFTQDGNSLATASKDGTIRIWKLKDINSIDYPSNGNHTKEFIISPNPANDYILINVGAGSKPALVEEIEIFNIFGEKMTTPSNLSGSTPLLAKEGIIKIDISNLAPGVYFVRVGDKFEKFVKL